MRILEKIKELEKFLSELESFIPEEFLEYEKDIKTKAACERYFEKITESIFDIINLLIKEKIVKSSEKNQEVIDILQKENIISQRLTENLKDAKGMRNILAHKYGNVDDKIVFESITKELIRDVNQFIKSVKKDIMGK
ncbi:DUF86 domain-containing protein [Candidatus Woesearchaeota archaeon]|nr:DUF86 domain-containing protein [Candidatus Woesearchaeota archaeon]